MPAERGGGWRGPGTLDAAASAEKRGSPCRNRLGVSSGAHSCTRRDGVCSTRTGSGDTDRRSHTHVHTVSLTAAKGEATVSADRRRAHMRAIHTARCSALEGMHALTQATTRKKAEQGQHGGRTL